MSTIHFPPDDHLEPRAVHRRAHRFRTRSFRKSFSNSADSYLQVHRKGPHDADVTEGGRGNLGAAVLQTGPIPTASGSRRPPRMCLAALPGYTYTLTRASPMERPT